MLEQRDRSLHEYEVCSAFSALLHSCTASDVTGALLLGSCVVGQQLGVGALRGDSPFAQTTQTDHNTPSASTKAAAGDTARPQQLLTQHSTRSTHAMSFLAAPSVSGTPALLSQASRRKPARSVSFSQPALLQIGDADDENHGPNAGTPEVSKTNGGNAP